MKDSCSPKQRDPVRKHQPTLNPSRSPAELVKLGAGLEMLGKYLTDMGKALASPQELEEDDDVGFTHKKAYPTTTINTEYVKEKYPQKKYPKMYKESITSGSVVLDLPFQNKLMGVK